MQGFSNVLVPIDFSESSEVVLDAAIRVLAPEGTATLLHVVEWMPVVTEGTFGVYAHRRDIDKLLALSQERLREYVDARPGLRLTPQIAEGKPWKTILEVAERLHPDLIVIGKHGRSRLDHFLLGSVAERVLRRASCHVLAVRA